MLLIVYSCSFLYNQRLCKYTEIWFMVTVYCVQQNVIYYCAILVCMVTSTIIHVLLKISICLYKSLMVINIKVNQLFWYLTAFQKGIALLSLVQVLKIHMRVFHNSITSKWTVQICYSWFWWVFRGNRISGAHSRFIHYPFPVMKAIKTNSGINGVISNIVSSLQHVCTISILLGEIEYMERQNVYDKPKKKQLSKDVF